MAAILETPSRIWRRIEAADGSHDMPSLPSVPAFEDSADIPSEIPSSTHQESDSEADEGEPPSPSFSPIHSTPAASSHYASTIRVAPSSTSSTARFASSLGRSGKSSLANSNNSKGLSGPQSQLESFDISSIPSLPDDIERSSDIPSVEESVPEEKSHLEEDIDMSLADALGSVSHERGRPTKERSWIDYEMPLKSSAASTPFSAKFKHVAVRRPMLERTRTPSLSRTTLSPASSPPNSTPKSGRSIALGSDRSSSISPIPAAEIPLPPSVVGSPAVPEPEQDVNRSSSSSSSMDITDPHISPIRQPTDDSESEVQDILDEEFIPNDDGTTEHTFSTDDGPTTKVETSRSPDSGDLASAFSFPAPSMATPTPAFPRARARFSLPDEPSSSNESHDGQVGLQQPYVDIEQSLAEEEEPMTPHTRRRSFLLSVINSTARPRIKVPTPHPRTRIPPSPGTPSMMTISNTPLPAGRMQIAFAGATPRPRFKPSSHPLAQTFTAVSSLTISESESGEEVAEANATVQPEIHEHVPWGTPVIPVATASASASPATRFSPYAPNTAFDEVLATGGTSFVSTASSHDLTTHPRANTSFDPAMGFAGNAPGHGVGRFNAGKLNTYLHGLNRRLQEENEVLLRELEEARAKLGDNPLPPTNLSAASTASKRRQSGGSSRRYSSVSNLGDLQEDRSGEQWEQQVQGLLEEKAELEDLVESYKNQVEEGLRESAQLEEANGELEHVKADLEKALEEEREERGRDKERWKERMGEVQSGVQAIVGDLETKCQKAEKEAKEANKLLADVEQRMADIEAERDDALEQADKAERALEVASKNQDLGDELKEAHDRVNNLMGDLRSANSHIKELEQELVRSEEFIDGMEHDLEEQRKLVVNLRKTIEEREERIEAQQVEVRHLEQTNQKIEEKLGDAEAYARRLKEDKAKLAAENEAAVEEQLEAMDEELNDAREEIRRLKMVEKDREAKGEQLAQEAERAAELARQMEEALEATEKKMNEDEVELATLRGTLAALEREKERQKELSTRTFDHSRSVSANAAQTAAHEAEIEALEKELDDAVKEIARLNTVLNQSPARKAVDKAKDAKIEMLEKENEALAERIKTLRVTMNEYNHNTPNRTINSSGVSPMLRRALSMSIRAPKTPGGPLRDMSWLNSTAGGSISTSPLVAEISRLQRELDLANESIDDKLDKLEDAGLGVVGLTKKLEDARSKIRALEDQIARLSRKEERRTHRLERVRCQKCLTKVDVRAVLHLADDESSVFENVHDTLPSEPPTPPTKTSDALRANLRTVTSQLQETKKQWENEKKKLLGEKAVLQDAASRLNAQVRDAKAEVNKAAEAQKAHGRVQDIQGDLAKARLTIAELESDLKAERARLRSTTAEQNRVSREKDQVFAQLQRTEADMEEVRSQLQTCKKENRELENELRVNANVEQRARLLETKVSENAETMEQLREERALLAADHKELQRRYTEISEHANRLLDNEAATRNRHDKHRHQVDLYLGEIEDLRKALSTRSNELHSVEAKVEAEKHRMANERSDINHTVSALQADLKRVRESAEAFGRDLKELRLEKDRLEKLHQDEQSKNDRAKKQSQTQIRLLTEQLEGQRAKTLRAKEELEKHVCAVDDRQLSALKLQHNKEAKGLIVQIRYLKAKFTRESNLRFDLAYQKHYLLILLNKFEKSERTISAAIARIGFPIPPPPLQSKRKLKSIVQSMIFISRVRRATEEWEKANACKPAIAAALEEVRQRRAAAAKSTIS